MQRTETARERRGTSSQRAEGFLQEAMVDLCFEEHQEFDKHKKGKRKNIPADRTAFKKHRRKEAHGWLSQLSI